MSQQEVSLGEGNVGSHTPCQDQAAPVELLRSVPAQSLVQIQVAHVQLSGTGGG